MTAHIIRRNSLVITNQYTGNHAYLMTDLRAGIHVHNGRQKQ